jgi:hypothetical protein
MKHLTHLFIHFFLASISLHGQDYFELDSTQYTLGVNTRYLNSVSTIQYGGNDYSYNLDQQSIGLRVRYKKAALVLSVAGFPVFEGQNRPTSRLGGVLRFYPKNMYFKIDGSYMSHNYSLFDYIRNFNSSFNSDLLVLNLDLHGMYMFNKNKIDLRSFFAFRNQQLKSAGSWAIHTYIKSSFVQNDVETLIGLGFNQEIIPDNMVHNRFGLGFGYLYSLKIYKNLHWANMLSLANEFHYSKTYGDNNSGQNTDFITLLKPHAFSCISYNYNKMYLGLQFEYFPSQRSSLSENSYTLEFFSIRLSAGYRW